MKNHRLFKFVLLLLVISGCTVVKSPHITRNSSATLVADQKSISANDAILRKDYCSELFLAEGFDVTSGKKGEWLPEELEVYNRAFSFCQKLPGDKSFFPSPNLGLALSGGGTRSGSFAIGVLKALNEISMPDGESLLRQVDVISSVSGGGYAAYWYLMQNYYRDPIKADCGKDIERNNINEVNEDIFRTRGDIEIFGDTKYQDHLATSSDLLRAYDNPLMSPLEDGWNFTGHLLTLPIHWVTNGIMDWRFNCSAAPLAYRQGIERTYGLVTKKSYSPLLDKCQDADCKYYNARSGYFAKFNDEAQADPVSFGQYRDFLSSRNSLIHNHNESSTITGYIHPLPLPIINTTLGTRTKKVEHIDDAVYTFTPLSYGSGLGGYIDDFNETAKVNLSKAYAISGAAVDGNAREANAIADFGLWLANGNLGYRYPNLNQTINRASFNLNRVLHYLSPLGFYHALDYVTPEAYKPFYRLSDGGHAENLGLYSIIKRAVRHVIVVDAEQDNDYQFDAFRRLEANISQEMGLEIKLDDSKALSDSYKDKRKPTPVFSGKVVGLNYPDETPQEINFLYLKLALDQDEYNSIRTNKADKCSTTEQIRNFDFSPEKKLPPLPCSVVDYIRSEPVDKKAKFPHNSTADIFYDEAQFRAFRDFGYYLAMTKLRPIVSTKSNWLSDLERYRLERFNFFNGLVQKAKASGAVTQ